MIFHKLKGIPDNTGFPFDKLLKLSYTKHASKRVFRYGKNNPVKPPERITIKHNDVITLETFSSNPNRWKNALVKKAYDKKQFIIFVFKNSRSRFRVITFYLIHKSEYQDFVKSKIKHMSTPTESMGFVDRDEKAPQQQTELEPDFLTLIREKINNADKKHPDSETALSQSKPKDLKSEYNRIDTGTSVIHEKILTKLTETPGNRYQRVTELVLAEIKRAKLKHGYVDFNSNHEGFSVMQEEVDEMWDAIRKDDTHDSVKEAIEVAAMAVRYAAERGHY